MNLISLNVGLPKLVMRGDEPVSTGIFKDAVDGRRQVKTLNIDGDAQADLTVHGGPNKAVYGYPSEHYEFWKAELPEMQLPWGVFGENFTTSGMLEDSLNIGDKFSVGSSILMITQPRMPCYKLGIRFGRSDILKRFLQSERSGFYFAVLQEGEVGAGDKFELIESDKAGLKVVDVNRLYSSDKYNESLLRRAIDVEALPGSWREYFQARLEKRAEDAP